ncbi:MAG: hypothetical protein J5873_07185 [Bacteroidales bacterium]|nr:hypothetical protein [Bacteroidales bacterium]
MNNNPRNALGTAKEKNVRLTPVSLQLSCYALLGLQPRQPEKEWLGLLQATTDWCFRKAVLHPFEAELTQPAYRFPVFYARRPGRHTAFLFQNTDESGERQLLSFQNNALYRIKSNTKVLPNQLALFSFEDEETPLTMEPEAFERYNPENIRRWNEITAYLDGHSTPLPSFSYLLPLSFQTYEQEAPLLSHLHKVAGLQYRYIAGESIGNDHLLYQLLRFQNELTQRINPPKDRTPQTSDPRRKTQFS